ncbi:AAA-domain-containing protein [Desarmillaria tabescens]|uniref:Peroxisomal ATPase PEX6 n=1 Tax=Armillaria tabescens TaxID=1929756 RepID=A0AA39N6V9_ARMTA|nr:AAA-domain-containing protein [Desarmillaria tabescens]KAK0459470.1 AAA-domain-containing protein [Desarmillaria tabescens]
MSLFFDSPFSVHAAFIVREDAEQSDDTVLVGHDLWDALSNQDASSTYRIGVSISSLVKRTSGSQISLSAVSCWAVLDDNITAGQIAIPQAWISIYPRVFYPSMRKPSSPPCLSVSPVHLLPLTEVFVTALSQEAYDMAQAHQTQLETWFSQGHKILRQGTVYTCNANSLGRVNGYINHEMKSLKYRLDTLEPVLQGFSDKGHTAFVICPLADENLDPTASESEESTDLERIEIGEDFLASSAGLSFDFPSDTEIEFEDHLDNMHCSGQHHSSPQSTFHVKPLLEPIQERLDDYTLYIRTSDLGRVGVLNGEWAVVHLAGSSKYRLVRVVADDSIISSTGCALGSSVLLHNICGESSPSLSSTIQLHPSPFGSGRPTIPVARSITVARVASPISVDRTYQTLFVTALQRHFEGAPTLVKAGDIIAVALNTDDQYDNAECDRYPLSDSAPGRANEAVFFVLTNIDHDVISNEAVSLSPDAYAGATLGELGCWFDSSVTRMVQTGVEHCRVPDASAYLGLDVQPKALSYPTISDPDSSFGKLFSIASVVLGKHSVSYNLPLSFLLSGARGTGKYTSARSVARLLGMHVLEINCYDAVGDNDTQTEGLLRARFEKATDCSPCLLILRQLDGLTSNSQGPDSKTGSPMINVLRDCLDLVHQSWKITGYPVMICGITNESSKLPPAFVALFKHEITFEAPNEVERYEILQSQLAGKVVAPDVSVSALATQTAALVAGDLVDLVVRAEAASIERAGSNGDYEHVSDIIQAGVALSNSDFEGALGKARASYSEGIGAPKIPNVSWDDVGGLAHVKSDILDTIQLPLDYPDLFSDGFKKRSGILLYGPPGTGKTLVAKAVATSFALNFFSVKGPELLNMYIGESEANVRRIFQRARDAKPCVIFFDELDSIAPKRGNHGDSGGVMDRIVSQLLSELDGMSGSGGSDVFVIGATNRPDLLDAALLRPGRFDRMLYLGVSKTHEEQLHILEALTRKFRLHPDFDLSVLAERCPFNLTGADFYALCSDALLNAMTRKAEELEQTITRLNSQPGVHQHPYPLTPQYYLAEVASQEEINVIVTEGDFTLALNHLVPSVSDAEMRHYANIQQQFSLDRSARPQSTNSE